MEYTHIMVEYCVKPNTKAPIVIKGIYWIVQAIDEWIIANNPLPCTCVAIIVDESTNLWVVVSALQVVEAGLGWVLLRTRRGCPLRDFAFRVVLTEKENVTVMYQQASRLVTQTQTCQEYSWNL